MGVTPLGEFIAEYQKPYVQTIQAWDLKTAAAAAAAAAKAQGMKLMAVYTIEEYHKLQGKK